MAIFNKKTAENIVTKTNLKVKPIELVPIVSEKSSRLQPMGQYSFEVARGVSKIEVKKFIEASYGVRVIGVNSVHLPGKIVRRGRSSGRTSVRRHIIVRLAKGQSLNLSSTV